MASYQALELDQLDTVAAGRVPYQELMRRPGFSLGVYRLPVGGSDHQHPHSSDEVYLVQSGRATLVVEGTEVPVGPGSVVSVDRGAEHQFTAITEDLTILVLFAPAEMPDA